MGWLIASIMFGIQIFVGFWILFSGNISSEEIPANIIAILFTAVVSVLFFKKYKKSKTHKSSKKWNKSLDHNITDNEKVLSRDQILNEQDKEVITLKWQLNDNINILNDCYNLMSKTKNFDTFKSRYELAREKISILNRCVYEKIIDVNIWYEWDKKIEKCYEQRYGSFIGNSSSIEDEERLEKQYLYCISRIDNGGRNPIELSEKEEVFIKALILGLDTINATKHLRINRMSNKTLNFCYGRTQIGRIKLQGRKTRMQVLNMEYKEGNLGVDWFEDLSLDEYIQKIKEWIKYTKNLSSYSG